MIEELPHAPLGFNFNGVVLWEEIETTLQANEDRTVLENRIDRNTCHAAEVFLKRAKKVPAGWTLAYVGDYIDASKK